MEGPELPPASSQLPSFPSRDTHQEFGSHDTTPRGPSPGSPSAPPEQRVAAPAGASGATGLSPLGTAGPSPPGPTSRPSCSSLLHLRADPAASRDPLILGSPCQGGRLREPLSQQSSISALPQASDVPGHPRSPAGQAAKGTPHSLHTGIHLGANPGCSRVGNMGCSRPVLHSPELQQGLVGWHCSQNTPLKTTPTLVRSC